MGKVHPTYPLPSGRRFSGRSWHDVVDGHDRISVGRHRHHAPPSAFFSWEISLRWLPSVIAASILYWAIVHIRSVLFLPFGLICISSCFTFGDWNTVHFARVAPGKWFCFYTHSRRRSIRCGKLVSLARIDWNVVLQARDEIPALVLVCTIGASLATTALEIGAEIELEPNHELRTHGLANLVSALVGGLPAFTWRAPH